MPLDDFCFVYFLSSCFDVVFISSRHLSGSILSSQTDPPTLTNVDFTIRILTFLKNQRFRSKDGFASVLELSRTPLWSSWESLGSSFGPLDRPKKASRFILELVWASFARLLLLLLFYVRASFFDVVFYLLLEPLGAGFEVPRRPSDRQKS